MATKTLMRRLAMLSGLMLFCAPAVLAQVLPNPIPVQLPSLCCQIGNTYGTTGSPPSCFTIPLFGPSLTSCKQRGGTLANGPCNKDGACGGSAVCCAGVSVGEACSSAFGGPAVAQVESCAIATEAACDSLSAAGERATVSMPFTTCTKLSTVPGGECVGPPPK
jgi:hypothetical protein